MKTVTHPNPSSNPESSATNPHEASAAAPKRSTCATADFPAVTSRIGFRPNKKSCAKRPVIPTEPPPVLKVIGVRYLGEYPVDSADGYTPGEFTAGDPITPPLRRR